MTEGPNFTLWHGGGNEYDDHTEKNQPSPPKYYHCLALRVIGVYYDGADDLEVELELDGEWGGKKSVVAPAEDVFAGDRGKTRDLGGPAARESENPFELQNDH